MNIGIVVYSQTGHTHSVALKLRDKLTADGHSAHVERIEITGELRSEATSFQLKTRPAVDAYDALVFAAPVRAFSLSPAMVSYLEQIASLQGKPVACLVTEFFPFPSMGGNQAVGQMVEICQSKGAAVCGSGIVNWSRPGRKRQIVAVVDRLSSLL